LILPYAKKIHLLPAGLFLPLKRLHSLGLHLCHLITMGRRRKRGRGKGKKKQAKSQPRAQRDNDDMNPRDASLFFRKLPQELRDEVYKAVFSSTRLA
jgi:hypothetical protein